MLWDGNAITLKTSSATWTWLLDSAGHPALLGDLLFASDWLHLSFLGAFISCCRLSPPLVLHSPFTFPSQVRPPPSTDKTTELRSWPPFACCLYAYRLKSSAQKAPLCKAFFHLPTTSCTFTPYGHRKSQYG